MSFIKLNNINKSFGKGEAKIEAIKDMNLEINKGDFVAIMGTSGSGTSTLLNIIGCLDTATSGEYVLDDKNINLLTKKELATVRNKTFGFIVQYFGLLNDRTVFENVQVPLEYAKIKSTERKRLVIDILKKLKIEKKINTIPPELSGGQSQRVAIARALVNNPDIILADEPTGALDSKTAEDIMRILTELNNEGKTVIIVTHDINIASYSKRIIKIEDGKIVSNLITNTASIDRNVD